MRKLKKSVDEWKESEVEVFWGEVAPCDHVVQIYEDDEAFLGTLTEFALHGFKNGDGVIIIATKEHLQSLGTRIKKGGYDVEDLLRIDQYVPVEASEMLSRFMVNGWPDEVLFHDNILGLIGVAGKGHRKVRAFGEMVALLWAEGKNGATVQLEKLWCRLHEKDNFSLYCAYPRSGFTQSLQKSVENICKSHSLIIDGKFRSSTNVYYRNS
jgi:hypothetical protein